MDCSLPGSPVHEILQARTRRLATSFCRGSSRPRDRTRVSCITRRFFIREAQQRLEFNSSQNGGMLPERHDSPSVLRRARTARVLPGGRAGSHTPTGKATPPPYEGWESHATPVRGMGEPSRNSEAGSASSAHHREEAAPSRAYGGEHRKRKNLRL